MHVNVETLMSASEPAVAYQLVLVSCKRFTLSSVVACLTHSSRTSIRHTEHIDCCETVRDAEKVGYSRHSPGSGCAQ